MGAGNFPAFYLLSISYICENRCKMAEDTLEYTNPEEYALSEAFEYIKKKDAHKKEESYIKKVQIRNQMAVHVSGEIPESLICNMRPGEPDVILQYRKANYEPTTQPIIFEALDSLARIFNPANYTLEYSDELKLYTDSIDFYGQHFLQFWQNVFLPFMIEDPNGYIVILPSGAGMHDVETGTEGIYPYIKCIPCDLIVEEEFEGGELAYLLFQESDNKYVLLTKTTYYEIEKIGREIGIKDQYVHNIGFVPAMCNKGKYNVNWRVYQSYFAAFVPFANESLRQESDHFASLVKTAYPTPIMVPVKCSNDNCQNGRIYGENGAYHDCRTCNGTGWMQSSPFQVILRKDPALGYVSNEKEPPPLEYVSPPTDILEFQQQSIENLRKNARRALHLNHVEEAQSGSAKAIDREGEYAMISEISNNVFDHIEFTLTTMEAYIKPNATKKPVTVVKPTKFDMKSESDLLQEFAALKNSGASDAILREVTREIIDKRYPGNDSMKERHNFLLEYDPLYVYSVADKQAMQMSNIISREQFVKSVNAPSLLDLALEQLGIDKITRADYDRITERLNQLIAANTPPQINGNLAGLVNLAG